MKFKSGRSFESFREIKSQRVFVLGDRCVRKVEMNVSRLLHLELSLRTAPRRFGSVSSTKQKRQLRNKPLLKRRFTNTFLRLPLHQWTLLSSNSEDQTVVDQEETNEVVEEEESKEEESPEEEKYKGPGAELINSMIETIEDGRLTTESVETWISSIKDEFMKLDDQINALTPAAEAENSELEESKAKYLRLSADFENFRKRAVSRESLIESVKDLCFRILKKTDFGKTLKAMF